MPNPLYAECWSCRRRHFPPFLRRPSWRLTRWVAEHLVPNAALRYIGRVYWCPVHRGPSVGSQIAAAFDVSADVLGCIVTDRGTWLRPWPNHQERLTMAMERAYAGLEARFMPTGW